MNTPIYDFVTEYTNKKTARFHMPGHKGNCVLGCESLDITEIKGADSLYEAEGIIRESEQNASVLFGCKTYYSTEGSSLCIRAALYLASVYAKEQNRPLKVFAGRNAHKTFLSACALLDFEISWIEAESNLSNLSFMPDLEKLDTSLSQSKSTTNLVYITSPDYLGKISDIKAISNVCKKHNALLFVDNAHGAYLKFLSPSLHPIDLGADICCDSAHKTLPVLTGGAYLHFSDSCPALFAKQAKQALSLFGSTSPSYLILQSLDLANKYMHQEYKAELDILCDRVSELKAALIKKGYTLYGDESLKITVMTKKYGYSGYDFANVLRQNNIEPEFCDPDFVVLMVSPKTRKKELELLEKTMLFAEKKDEITVCPPSFSLPKKRMTPKEATFSPMELLPVSKCIGKTAALSNVGCPPAVPIIFSGEVIDENTVRCFEYFGIKDCLVVKE